MLRPVNKIRDVWPGSYEWSPDGRSIIYQNDAGVWVADACGQASRRRFAVQALPWAWSPDRRWIVFGSFRQRLIQVATASGRERRVLTRKIKNCCPIDEIEWAPR
jgi:Tol biopolymer transport system component